MLTVDLGNSRCKLRVWGGGPAPLRSADLATGPALAAALAAWLGAGEVERALVCSVAADAALAELRAALARTGCREVHEPDDGLRLDLRSPDTVGRDRLFAARGALAACRRGVVVVDAGTALTVDAALAPRAGEAHAGIFLGGAIAPGPELAAEALARASARLPRIAPRPGVPALGKDTRGALEAGVGVGFEGAALRLVARVSAEAGLARAPIVLTGGARAFLAGALSELGRELLEDADLVHRGLLAAAGSSLGSAR